MDTQTDATLIASATTSQPDPVTVAGPPPLDPAVKDACMIAVGESPADERSTPHRCWAAKRGLNCKGNGGESYRRVLRAGTKSWEFLSSERLPRGTYLAADRKASVYGEGFRGDLLASYSRSLRGGKSQQSKATLDEVRIVVGKHSGEWLSVPCVATRRRDGRYDIILPSGQSLTVASPDW